MRNLFTLALIVFCCGFATAQNNITKTAGVNYTQGAPTYNPSQKTGSEYAIDTTNGRFYQFHRASAVSGTWKLLGQGIDTLDISGPPTYAPTRNVSWFAINQGDSLYRYSGAGIVWNCLNCCCGGGGGGLVVDSLNYYTCDSTAMADGLAEGDPYLLDCNNCYGLPAGLFKVVKICGFDCNYQLRYFPNDSTAVANGIPPGREYVLDEDNLLGILYGFIKVAYPDSIPGGTLECNDDLPEFDNDLDAIMGGRLFGDLYTMTDSNTYGAPEGTERAVSSISSTVADAPNCCDATGRLPFYDNDTAAISGGLSSGFYYYLDSTNTYGYPYGSKKRIP